jgi:hypothetical protein
MMMNPSSPKDIDTTNMTTDNVGSFGGSFSHKDLLFTKPQQYDSTFENTDTTSIEVNDNNNHEIYEDSLSGPRENDDEEEYVDVEYDDDVDGDVEANLQPRAFHSIRTLTERLIHENDHDEDGFFNLIHYRHDPNSVGSAYRNAFAMSKSQSTTAVQGFTTGATTVTRVWR